MVHAVAFLEQWYVRVEHPAMKEVLQEAEGEQAKGDRQKRRGCPASVVTHAGREQQDTERRINDDLSPVIAARAGHARNGVQGIAERVVHHQLLRHPVCWQETLPSWREQSLSHVAVRNIHVSDDQRADVGHGAKLVGAQCDSVNPVMIWAVASGFSSMGRCLQPLMVLVLMVLACVKPLRRLSSAERSMTVSS